MCFRPPSVDGGPVPCPSCGAMVDPTVDQCPNCGAKADNLNPFAGIKVNVAPPGATSSSAAPKAPKAPAAPRAPKSPGN